MVHVDGVQLVASSKRRKESLKIEGPMVIGRKSDPMVIGRKLVAAVEEWLNICKRTEPSMPKPRERWLPLDTG